MCGVPFLPDDVMNTTIYFNTNMERGCFFNTHWRNNQLVPPLIPVKSPGILHWKYSHFTLRELLNRPFHVVAHAYEQIKTHDMKSQNGSLL
jgi:hypothetical protein